MSLRDWQLIVNIKIKWDDKVKHGYFDLRKTYALDASRIKTVFKVFKDHGEFYIEGSIDGIILVDIKREQGSIDNWDQKLISIAERLENGKDHD